MGRPSDSKMLQDLKRKVYLDAVRRRLFEERQQQQQQQQHNQQQHNRQTVPLQLTAEERWISMQYQLTTVLATLSSGLGVAAHLVGKLRLVDYDAAKLALVSGRIGSLVSLCNLVLGPMVGSLSDRFGRLPFRYPSVLTAVAWPLCMTRFTSIERYQEAAVLLFGVLSAGAGTVAQASLDDTFGSRPVLRATVEARASALGNACGLVAPLIGAAITTSLSGQRLALLISAAVAAIQLPVLALSRETLPRAERKPFQLAKADPMANLALLFTKGLRLRMLTLAQIGTLGWSAGDQTYFRSFQSLLGMLSQGAIVVPLMKRYGAKRATEIGGKFATVALLLVSQCWRPHGAGRMRQALQLVAAMCVMLPAMVSGVAGRSVLITQGLRSTAAGPGELNAAVSGLTSLLNVGVPIFWGNVHNYFATAGAGTWWHQPGGAFMLAAGIRAVSVIISAYFVPEVAADGHKV